MPDQDGKLFLSSNAVLHRQGGAWLLSDLVTREHVEINAAGIAAITSIVESAPISAWRTALKTGMGVLRTNFDPERGLWADPTGLGPPQSPPVTGDDLVSLLVERRLLVSSAAAYEAYLGPLTSILDVEHMGTFNDRVGRYLLRDRRMRETWRWWHDQKFAPDGREMRPGPYKCIQQSFFDRYFGQGRVDGKAVLDFACGNGHYAARFRRYGACRVVGIDTSRELIEIAKSNHGDLGEFVFEPNNEAVLAFLRTYADEMYDVIYLSDVFLILAENDNDEAFLAALLAEFRRLLRDSGALYMMEPNGIFWLSPRLGESSAPMVVVTEYRQRRYGVAPTFDDVCRSMTGVGFGLVEFQHPGATPECSDDVRSFAARYPMWDFTAWTKVSRDA